MNMINNNYLLAVFATVISSILLESIPVKAFNLIYKYPLESPNYVNEAEYITPSKNKGKVELEQIQKISPPNVRLLQAFKAQFPSYNFEASYTPIYGDFVVNSYQVCPPAPNPGFCPDVFAIVGSSGGGGVDNERPGGTQQNPILPNAREGNWQVFRNVPGCRWYDPPTTYGFEFQALEDTLFTEILDFPVGDDDRFTVSVGDKILGEFGAGQNVDFVSLFGSGISNFKITGIDSLFGSTEETAFPIQLAFNNRRGSFKMRPISQETSPQPVPEFTSALGLFALGAWGIIKAMKIRFEK